MRTQFRSRTMEDLNRFYTYAYLREDRSPYYVGKGKENRVYKKHQKGVSVPKDKSRIIFLKQNLTEEEAFKHEKYMISVFGRKDLGTGILRNRSDGGEGPSGAVRSEEWRRSISEKMSKNGKGCASIGGKRQKNLDWVFTHSQQNNEEKLAKNQVKLIKKMELVYME